MPKMKIHLHEDKLPDWEVRYNQLKKEALASTDKIAKYLRNQKPKPDHAWDNNGLLSDINRWLEDIVHSISECDPSYKG